MSIARIGDPWNENMGQPEPDPTAAELARLRALVLKYETRLEITHVYTLRPKSERIGNVDNDLERRELSPEERERCPDAVECRDATIALLESNLDERDKMLDVAAKGMEALRAALSDRDRQLAELRRENEAMRGGIRYWSFCTRQGMLKWCPEKDAELREFHRVLGIYPDATDPDAGLPTLHDLRGILKPKEDDRAAKE